MRVFVSSTVYDLLDTRAELELLLRELGLTPVMSDDKLTDFNLSFDVNSIETCLLNVETCDTVIFVLDQRYGPKLGSFGFDDVSATHLEYRHAKKHSKRIYFYVRDRLEADFSVRQKNKGADVKFSWVSPRDIGLFDFLEEHRSLKKEPQENNWCSFFTNIVDLKASIRRKFEPVIKPQTLLKAIQENRFPLFTHDFGVEMGNLGGVQSFKCQMILKNVGLAPAFDVTTRWCVDGHKAETSGIVASQQEISMMLIANASMGDVRATFTLEYQSIIGITVREEYSINCFIRRGAIVSGATLQSRTYHSSPPPALIIEEA